MNLLSKVVTGFKQLDMVSISIIYYGLQFSCGLVLLAYIFYLFVGRYGNAMAALACAHGALEAAPMIATFSLAGGIVFDLAKRDKNGGDA